VDKSGLAIPIPSKAESTLLGIARAVPQRTALSMMAAFGRHRDSGVGSSLTGNGRGGEAGKFEAIEFVSR